MYKATKRKFMSWGANKIVVEQDSDPNAMLELPVLATPEPPSEEEIQNVAELRDFALKEFQYLEGRHAHLLGILEKFRQR